MLSFKYQLIAILSFVFIIYSDGDSRAQENDPICYILGNVKSVMTKKNLENCEVKLYRSDGQVFHTNTDSLGNYKFDDRYCKVNFGYTILVEGPKNTDNNEWYYSAKGTETTTNMKQSTAFVHDFELQPPHSYTPFPCIDFKREIIDSDSVVVELIQVANDNPTIVIGINAHYTSEKDSLIMVDRLHQLKLILDNSSINKKRFVYGFVVYLEGLDYVYVCNKCIMFEVLRDDFEE